MNQPFLYSAFGLCIASELELPELPPGAGDADVVFRRGPVPLPLQKAGDGSHTMITTIAGRFQMNGGREIVVDPLPHADTQAVRLVLLGRAMAALLRQRGWLPLHGSGVAIDGRAVLFLGPSGAGKSTAAAALHARGHSVVTDDVAAVRTVEGVCSIRPAFSRLRLSDLSLPLLNGNYSNPVLQVDKYALTLQQEELPPLLPVERTYILDFADESAPDELRVEDLPRLLAAASLSVHSFFRRSDFEMDTIRLHVQACAVMAEVVPVRQILRARSFLSLPRLVRLVEDDMAGCK